MWSCRWKAAHFARYGGAYVGTLEHWNYDIFRAKRDAAWRGTTLVTFGIDANGEPSRVEVMGAAFIRADTRR